MGRPSLYPISGQCTRKYLFLPPDEPLLDSVFVRSFNVCRPSFHCESGDRREHDMNSKATRVSEKEPGAAGLARAGPAGAFFCPHEEPHRETTDMTECKQWSSPATVLEGDGLPGHEKPPLPPLCSLTITITNSRFHFIKYFLHDPTTTPYSEKSNIKLLFSQPRTGPGPGGGVLQ